MNVITQIDQWLEVARQLNYQIRYDDFGGTGGGICEVAGRQWLFIDLVLSPLDQLEHLRRAIESDPLSHTLTLPTDQARRAA